ncbi:MAG: hypothetical protein C4519_06720 [Desulfobacteraceae bacterium]|nr:MAG: hypothetical protein C4519_06720 [Desulfobacteraceae bacterium]
MKLFQLTWCVVLVLIAFAATDGHAAEKNPAPPANGAYAYSVQLVPFKALADAEHWIQELGRKGYHPYIHQGSDAQGVPWFAVRIADYPTPEEAAKALNEFKRAENLAGFVTRRDTIFPSNANGLSSAALQAQTEAPSSALLEQLETLQKRIEDLEKEAEARRILRMTEEEKSKTEAEVLTAAGREYTLIPRNRLDFEYNLSYDYFSSDILQDLRNTEGGRLYVERRGNHTLTNQLLTEYGVLDNLSLNFGLPFVFKYDKRTGEDREVTDLGDISLGLQYQPFKAGGTWPAPILSLSGIFPTGRSPYKINPEEDLATGNGYYAVVGGVALSKTLDPVVVFGSISYIHPFTTSRTEQILNNGLVLDEVDPGDRFGFSLGIGFALSYTTSLTLSYDYAYHLKTNYLFTNNTSIDSNSWVTSSFNIGTGWQISPRFSLYTRVDIGLTNDDPDFSFSIRIPVRFDLGD